METCLLFLASVLLLLLLCRASYRCVAPGYSPLPELLFSFVGQSGSRAVNFQNFMSSFRYLYVFFGWSFVGILKDEGVHQLHSAQQPLLKAHE